MVIGVMGMILATVASQSRKLALRQARVSRERANLSRYFSPDLVDSLASGAAPGR